MEEIEWIKAGLGKPGKTKAGLASALGRSPSAVTMLLNGRRRLQLAEIPKVAAYLEVDPPIDIRSPFVRIVGKAGAGNGSSVVFEGGEGFPYGELGEAPATPGTNTHTVALMVEGDSMRGIAQHGWLIYYDERHDPPDPSMHDELCVCGLADGRVMVKFLHPTGRDGLFDLESTNERTIRDVEVEWAAIVTCIIPGVAAARMIRHEEIDDPDEILKIEKRD